MNDENVTNISKKLVSKQTFMRLEGGGLPWQFGLRLPFGINIYVECYTPSDSVDGD